MEFLGVKNITDYLFAFAGASPDKLILLHPQKVTYKEFCDYVDSYASGFLKSGIQKGTKTIILIKPGLDLFAVTFALFRIAAVPVMIDPGMGNKAMVKALSKIGAEAFVGIPKALLLKYIFPKEFRSVKMWISTGFPWFWKGISLKEFRKTRDEKYLKSEPKPDDVTAVFFTSGSTGPAKGVVYKNYMFDAQLKILKNHFNYNPQEIDLCTFPLIGLFSMCLGLSVVLADMDMTRPARLNPGKLVENINRFNCTYMFCSPMVLKKLADYGNKNKLQFPSLKKIMTAGAPVSPELLGRFNKLILEEAQIHTPYGATEALPVTDIVHNELLELYKDSNNNYRGICVGYPLKNIDLQIIGITDGSIKNWEDVTGVGNGKVGEIVIKGNNVTQSYLNNLQADELSKIEDFESEFLWHRTGDLGRLDEKGRVWFYGRKSQRVVLDEQTLFTVPTEAVFNKHQAVERSAFVGVAGNDKTKPVVCIQLKMGSRRSKKLISELINLAKEADFTKDISEFIFRKQFPVDPRHNAKIYREKLARWAQKKIK